MLRLAPLFLDLGFQERLVVSSFYLYLNSQTPRPNNPRHETVARKKV